MRALYYTIYLFYTRIIKEKEIPFFYCSLVMSILITFNINTIISFYSLISNSGKANLVPSGVYITFNSILLLISLIFFYNKRSDIIAFYTQKPKKERIRVVILSSIYVVVSLVLFFWVSYKIRQKHWN